jgi:hypothetical protein
MRSEACGMEAADIEGSIDASSKDGVVGKDRNETSWVVIGGALSL